MKESNASYSIPCQQTHKIFNTKSMPFHTYLLRFAEVNLSITVVVQLAVDGLNGCKLQFIAQCKHLCIQQRIDRTCRQCSESQRGSWVVLICDGSMHTYMYMHMTCTCSSYFYYIIIIYYYAAERSRSITKGQRYQWVYR